MEEAGNTSHPAPVSTGGAGGGGNGTYNTDGTHGQSGTGGGGGGSAYPGKQGGSGGSGVVSTPLSNRISINSKATGGVISYYNGKTIHTFLTSGTFNTTSTLDGSNRRVCCDWWWRFWWSNGINARGGGGGAGAYRTGTTPIGAHPTDVSVQVGAGGAPLGYVAPQLTVTVHHHILEHPLLPLVVVWEELIKIFGPSVGYPGIAGGSGGGGGGHPSTPGGNGTGDPFPGTIGATPPNGWGHPGGDGSPSGNQLVLVVVVLEHLAKIVVQLLHHREDLEVLE